MEVGRAIWIYFLLVNWRRLPGWLHMFCVLFGWLFLPLPSFIWDVDIYMFMASIFPSLLRKLGKQKVAGACRDVRGCYTIFASSFSYNRTYFRLGEGSFNAFCGFFLLLFTVRDLIWAAASIFIYFLLFFFAHLIYFSPLSPLRTKVISPPFYFFFSRITNIYLSVTLPSNYQYA